MSVRDQRETIASLFSEFDSSDYRFRETNSIADADVVIKLNPIDESDKNKKKDRDQRSCMTVSFEFSRLLYDCEGGSDVAIEIDSISEIAESRGLTNPEALKSILSDHVFYLLILSQPVGSRHGDTQSATLHSTRSVSRSSG